MESSERIELPASFEDVSIDHLVVLIADMLERLIAHNDQIPLVPEGLTRFHSRSSPNISVLEYLRRIVRFTNVEKLCLILTLHYIDQICARMPLFTISSLTAHRFIVASVTVSSKAYCDAFCTNAYYAKVGGISVVELNVLEREFLRIIDWHLMCTGELLQEYYVNLVRTHSSGKFVIPVTTQQSSSGSSDSEIEVDSSHSRPMSPMESNAPAGGHQVPHGASTILIDTVTLSPQPSHGPTIEQNMAFAALRESMDQS
ncbi:cyclin-domain-containing protein [Neolentinus lepideus HHB14362 ss-1]|uniref:Cyclin-domain-containing protein n=1 Tax=Neolentinus lepideus HHB14362 ss-1 TaxID=1314782 RepID=A0A165TKS0_9AGAM|nr:cyclin-domain-containing protein [Neolentinus lepideus HHB14362 ss-1]